ncbi:unnamed protein product, partial [Iphiclides podalirius]
MFAQLLLGRDLRTRLDTLIPSCEQRVAATQRAQARATGGTVRGFSPGDTVCHQWFLTGTAGESRWHRPQPGEPRRKRRGNQAFLPRLQKVGCGEYAIVGHRSALE